MNVSTYITVRISPGLHPSPFHYLCKFGPLGIYGAESVLKLIPAHGVAMLALNFLAKSRRVSKPLDKLLAEVTTYMQGSVQLYDTISQFRFAPESSKCFLMQTIDVLSYHSSKAGMLQRCYSVVCWIREGIPNMRVTEE